jgi:hypothetical protein
MNFYLILLVITIGFSGIIFQDEKPVISYSNGSYTLNLPQKMKSALQKFNPDFKEWKTEDYSSSVVEDVKQDGNPHRGPFSLIVDANKDNIPDVIIDGHDKKNSLLLCIISNDQDFDIVIIEKNELCDPSEIISFNEGKRESGLNYFLWPSEAEDLPDSSAAFIFSLGFPQQTNGDGELLNDGGIIDYYYENGTFRAEREIL